MNGDFIVEELKRSILNLSEARAQLETKALVYANPVKNIFKTRRTVKKRPSKLIRILVWSDITDWSKEDEEDDRHYDTEHKSVPRRRARRIKLNWDPTEDTGEDRKNDAERAHGPIITTFSSKSRRLLMK